MGTALAAIVLDNPILIKHLRARLRPTATLSWVGGVALVCLAILIGNFYAYGGLGRGYELQWLLALQVYLLGMQAPFQVSAAIGGARESGIFEYHRLSPLPASWIGVGFVLGAPIREWLLWGATLPFALVAARGASIGVTGFLAFEVPIVLGALITHALGALTALASRKPKGNAQGGSIGVGILAITFSFPIMQGINLLVGFLCDPNETRTFPFYGLPMHWLAFLILYQGSALAFALLAVIRKSAADRAHALSKAQAVLAMAVAATLAVGAAWDVRANSDVTIGLLYGLVVASSILVATVAIDRFEYVRGLKRSWRQGRRRPLPWRDDASSQWTVYAIAAVVAIAGNVVWERNPGAGASSVCVALAAFTTAELGLGFQYARLRMGLYGGFVFTLFVLLTWLVPLGVATLLAMARNDHVLIRTVAAVSPIAGLALASEPGWLDPARTAPGTGSPALVSMDVIRLVAIVPTLFFASLFNLFLVVWQRKLDWVVRHAAESKKAGGPIGD